MFTFRDGTEDGERLKQRIRRIVGSRHAMHIDELRMRLGMGRTAVQAELNAMLACGEIERLRPIAYPREDHDFFRVDGPATVVVGSGDRYISQVANNAYEDMRLADAAMECLAG
jgi:hypothetical protein